jgi:hypothetical protein
MQDHALLHHKRAQRLGHAADVVERDMVKKEHNKRVIRVILWKLGVANKDESTAKRSCVMSDVLSWKGMDHVDTWVVHFATCTFVLTEPSSFCSRRTGRQIFVSSHCVFCSSSSHCEQRGPSHWLFWMLHLPMSQEIN